MFQKYPVQAADLDIQSLQDEGVYSDSNYLALLLPTVVCTSLKAISDMNLNALTAGGEGNL